VRNIPDAIGHINRLIVHGGTNVSQVRRALCEDQTEFGQMSSQRIDCLRSLPDKALMGTAFSLSGPPPEMARGASFYRDDAAWLLGHGRSVLITDAGPAMTQVASAKLARFPDARVETVQAEGMEAFAARLATEGVGKFDGVYSNFAGLNCVTDLSPFARGLASLVRPGGQALLVIFGTFSPGEMITECLRGRPQNALRRLKKGDVPARLSGQHFTVRYHRRADLARAMAPWFTLVETRAIGLFVPPSAAEPWISKYPRLIGLFEALDKILARPLAIFGDHILYRLVRTDEPAPPAAQP